MNGLPPDLFNIKALIQPTYGANNYRACVIDYGIIQQALSF